MNHELPDVQAGFRKGRQAQGRARVQPQAQGQARVQPQVRGRAPARGPAPARGGSQALCQVPRLGNLLWALELLPQCKNSFGIIILQFVCRLLHGCVVELMATFFKKTYATCCASQDCCSQSPCPHGKPLLIHTFIGDTQTPKTKSTQSVSGRGHCPGSKKCESAGTQYASKSGRLSSEHRSGKGPFFIPNPKKGNAIECSNYHTTALISQANKVMHKILQFGISLLFHVRF